MEENDTPLWLDLRKEYIDDNFDKLLPYLRTCSGQERKDGFYNITLNLLRQRVEAQVEFLSNRPLYKEDVDEVKCNFNIRLFGAYLLVDDAPLALQAYVCMMSELRELVSEKFHADIMNKVRDRLTHERVYSYGFTWQDIQQFTPDIFAYKALNDCRFGVPLAKPVACEVYGTALLTDQGLYLSRENRSHTLSLYTGNGTPTINTNLGISLLVGRNQKLKESLATNIPDIAKYVTDFYFDLPGNRIQQEQMEAPRRPAPFEGDEVLVEITQIVGDRICVKTVDEKYEKVEGYIDFPRPNILYYGKQTFARYLQVGNCLKATVLSSLQNVFAFSIEQQFVSFVVEACRESYAYDDALYKCITKTDHSLIWINADGFPVSTALDRMYDVGSHAIITITQYATDRYYGLIKGEITDEANDDDYVDTIAAQRNCLEEFGTLYHAPNVLPVVEEKETVLPVNLLAMLMRLCYAYQRTLLKPLDRYLVLSNAYIMAGILGDDTSASYIRFNTDYLQILVLFARKEDYSKIHLNWDPEYAEADATLIRRSIVQLLGEYGCKDDSEVLAETISIYKDKIPVLANLARLIQTANSMQGTLSEATMNVIRREILKTLCLETEKDTDIEAEAGAYLGIEGGTQEFKTSIVYPPENGGQPDQRIQTLNVLRGVCAFLNSTTGGTLYLGVNDQGYIVGLQNDMKYFNYQSLDSYMRFIQDQAKQYFGIDTLPYLKINAEYDGQVVAIRVSPHPYRVVELAGEAYLRINAESRTMPETLRQQMIAQKVFKDKDKAAALSALQHAFTEKVAVTLHSYASSNSGSMSDRKVEAYLIHPEEDLVICYDLGVTTPDKIRVFNLNRIGWVEVHHDTKWQFVSQHRKVEVDHFHMSGNNPISISLELDLMARNLLCEEYPRAKADITQSKGDPNTWFYNTRVFDLAGITRFYVGLANHIKILHAPELTENVRKYVAEHLGA